MKDKREKEIIKTSIIGIIGNILLVAFKGFVGFIAGSIAIIMDALNNLTDALSSVITILGTKLSNKKPDKNHPYGYGKIEYITSSIIAFLILFAGSMAIYESVRSLINYYNDKVMPSFDIYALIIVSGAILAKIAIGLFFKSKAKKIKSDALNASGTDALFDSVLSLSTLVSIIFVKYLNIYIEGYLGIIIGLFIIKSGFEILKESLSGMIGERFDREFILNVKNDINNIDGVLGTYDIIMNSYGHNKNIGSCHIGVDESLKASDIQAIERQITELLYTKYDTIMTIGIYAQNSTDSEVNNLLKIVRDVINNYDNILQLHGFYLDKKRKILSFDLVVSFDDKKPLDTINNIKNEVSNLIKDYNIIINYDQDFSLSE